MCTEDASHHVYIRRYLGIYLVGMEIDTWPKILIPSSR